MENLVAILGAQPRHQLPPTNPMVPKRKAPEIEVAEDGDSSQEAEEDEEELQAEGQHHVELVLGEVVATLSPHCP